MKVNFFEKNVRNKFWQFFSVISGIISFILLFVNIPENYKLYLTYIGIFIFFFLGIIYLSIWIYANNLKNINVNIDGSTVNIKCGDIFNENGLKVITFNEYFDTQVNEKIISSRSLNGIFINKFFKNKVSDLDDFFKNESLPDDIINQNVIRPQGGKTIKFKLSSSYVYNNEFVLTAFTKFDNQNRAVLTMPEYIEFLINFWDRINRVYAQRTVNVPVFGSGITRIKEHKNINDEELLKIMLWTFKLSEMKFKYPAKLTIVIHKDKIAQINLFDVKSIELGI